jgi:hypothetical protein
LRADFHHFCFCVTILEFALLVNGPLSSIGRELKLFATFDKLAASLLEWLGVEFIFPPIDKGFAIAYSSTESS